MFTTDEEVGYLLESQLSGMCQSQDSDLDESQTCAVNYHSLLPPS